MEQTEKKEQVNNKKKVAKLSIIAVIAVILIISIIVTLGVIQGKQNTIDERGNLSNLGFAASSSDGVVYYNKYDEGIVKVKGSEEMQITNENAYSINVVDDTIYYLNIEDSSNICIKSVSSNGSNLTTIATIKTSISKIYVDGDYIYYAANGTNAGIVRVTLDGTEQETIVSSAIKDFEVIDGTIYFSNDIGTVYKMDNDGSNCKAVESDYDIDEFQVKDEWIYYYNEDNINLCKVSSEGGTEVVVSEYVNSSIFNVTKKKIYFLNSESKMLASVDLDGGNYKELTSISTNKTKISVVDDVIYYLDAAEDSSKIYQMYRIKTNGSSAKTIEY